MDAFTVEIIKIKIIYLGSLTVVVAPSPPRILAFNLLTPEIFARLKFAVFAEISLASMNEAWELTLVAKLTKSEI